MVLFITFYPSWKSISVSPTLATQEGSTSFRMFFTFKSRTLLSNWQTPNEILIHMGEDLRHFVPLLTELYKWLGKISKEIKDWIETSLIQLSFIEHHFSHVSGVLWDSEKIQRPIRQSSGGSVHSLIRQCIQSSFIICGFCICEFAYLLTIKSLLPSVLLRYLSTCTKQ